MPSDKPSEGQFKKVAGEFTLRSLDEEVRDSSLLKFAANLLPKLGSQWNVHSLAFLKRQSLSRILYYNHIYEKALNIPGVICEFGVLWGATTSLLINLRGHYEPFNHTRKIFSFDTFEGFPSVHPEDGSMVSVGDYATTPGYELLLNELLELHESFSPLPHIRKFELVKGDVSITFPVWLEQNPHAVVALAIFDMDIYKPTRDVLELIIPRLTKGSVLVFDEINCAPFPGETVAVQEILGLNNIALRRLPYQPWGAWAIFGE